MCEVVEWYIVYKLRRNYSLRAKKWRNIGLKISSCQFKILLINLYFRSYWNFIKIKTNLNKWMNQITQNSSEN